MYPTILAYPQPKTLKQLRGFLVITGFCRTWIHGYGKIARPLYTLIKETQRANILLIRWTPEAEAAFQALTQAPVLSLPTGQDFSLYVTEKTALALGVLTQVRGTSLQPVASLSKEIDVVAKGQPHCLRVVAAIAVLVSIGVKIIQGRDLTVWTSHDVNGILTAKGDLWLLDNCLLKY
uniref:Reverse transcriptase/retrotransposon-derived protein RNase H-like domain-containing protein n=1 Tax=Macaca fascicularis TaxID=9541 RepID=A0A7N9D1Y1_MACFA